MIECPNLMPMKYFPDIDCDLRYYDNGCDLRYYDNGCDLRYHELTRLFIRNVIKCKTKNFKTNMKRYGKIKRIRR